MARAVAVSFYTPAGRCGRYSADGFGKGSHRRRAGISWRRETGPSSMPGWISIIAAPLGGAIVFAAGLWVMFAATVKRNLRPLAEIADRATRIDAHSLQLAFSTQKPSHRAGADLRSLQRSAGPVRRGFSSRAAVHGRCGARIADADRRIAIAGGSRRGRWPGDSNPPRPEVFGDALDIARHMERMVTTLLTLSRCDAGQSECGNSRRRSGSDGPRRMALRSSLAAAKREITVQI